MPRAWSRKRERQYEHITESNEARERGIRGRSRMTKPELRRAGERKKS